MDTVFPQGIVNSWREQGNKSTIRCPACRLGFQATGHLSSLQTSLSPTPSPRGQLLGGNRFSTYCQSLARIANLLLPHAPRYPCGLPAVLSSGYGRVLSTLCYTKYFGQPIRKLWKILSKFFNAKGNCEKYSRKLWKIFNAQGNCQKISTHRETVWVK